MMGDVMGGATISVIDGVDFIVERNTLLGCIYPSSGAVAGMVVRKLCTTVGGCFI